MALTSVTSKMALPNVLKIVLNQRIFYYYYFLAFTELPCETDGFAGNYEDYPRAATHWVPNPFDPHFLSPWTNDPHKIDHPGQTVPIKFGPHGQMVRENLVPLDKWSPTNLVPIFPDPHSLSLWTNGIF